MNEAMGALGHSATGIKTEIKHIYQQSFGDTNKIPPSSQYFRQFQ
jgi:hypothetical protein